jgi:hypothetical protein
MSDFFSKILAVFPKEVRDNWVLIILLIIGGMYFMNYLNMKGSYGYGTDMMSGNDQAAYKKQGGSTASSGAKPAEDIDGSGNGSFASVNGAPSNGGMPSSCSKPNMQNPADLLPKDNNSQWAQLNPAGKGDLENINLLKAGYHIGIDTVGQTLRNANLQIRSEPPNPQVSVGPWNLSTIEADFMRVPLEIGQGSQ